MNTTNSFVCIPTRVITECSPYAILAFIAINSHCYNGSSTCYATISNLSKFIGIARITLRRGIEELITKGFIVETPDTAKAGRYATREFAIAEDLFPSREKQDNNITEAPATKITTKAPAVKQPKPVPQPLPEGNGLDWLKSELRPLGEAFLRYAGDNLTPKTQSAIRLWYKSLNEWRSAGVTPDDVKNAIYILREKHFNVSGPQSITKTAVSIAAQNFIRQNHADDFYEAQGLTK